MCAYSYLLAAILDAATAKYLRISASSPHNHRRAGGSRTTQPDLPVTEISIVVPLVIFSTSRKKLIS